VVYKLSAKIIGSSTVALYDHLTLERPKGQQPEGEAAAEGGKVVGPC